MRLAKLVKENVRGLQIAMQNSLGMCVMNRLRNSRDILGCTSRWQWAVPDDIRERFAVHKIHRIEGLAVQFPSLMNGHDMRMLQPPRCGRLGANPFLTLGRGKGS